MKLISFIITCALLLSPLAGVVAATPTLDGKQQKKVASRYHASPPADDDEDAGLERAVATEADALVTLCLESGDVVVRGWDKKEVRARVREAGKLELRRTGGASVAPPAITPLPAPRPNSAPPLPPNIAGATPRPPSAPIPPTANEKGVEVLVSNSEEDELEAGDCHGSGQVELDVPRGATVRLQIRSGDINIDGVAGVFVEALSGDIEARNVARAVEVESISGSIFLSDVAGRVRVRAHSGDVEARNARAVDADDAFVAKATSGSISLDGVTHRRVEASTVSGEVSVEGPLTRGGSYNLNSYSGDVSLTIPSDASFKLHARVISGGEIITAFAVKSPAAANADPFKQLSQGRLVGTVGTGDADVRLSSFNGTLHLRKK